MEKSDIREGKDSLNKLRQKSESTPSLESTKKAYP